MSNINSDDKTLTILYWTLIKLLCKVAFFSFSTFILQPFIILLSTNTHFIQTLMYTVEKYEKDIESIFVEIDKLEKNRFKKL